MDVSYDGCEIKVKMIPVGLRSGAPATIELHVADRSGVKDDKAECTLYLSPTEAQVVARQLLRAAARARDDQAKN